MRTLDYMDGYIRQLVQMRESMIEDRAKVNEELQPIEDNWYSPDCGEDYRLANKDKLYQLRIKYNNLTTAINSVGNALYFVSKGEYNFEMVV